MKKIIEMRFKSLETWMPKLNDIAQNIQVKINKLYTEKVIGHLQEQIDSICKELKFSEEDFIKKRSSKNISCCISF